ncbi:hypothetical protein GEMRC1_007694 [Eukaryota sp. GEM-RC1]
MTRALFEEYCVELNNKVSRENRRVVLLVDNVPSHKISVRYSHLRLAFWSPNTTALLQQLDQGIIRSLKCYYKRGMAEFWLQQVIKGETPDMKQFSAFDAVQLVTSGWKHVEKSVIQNCWTHTQLLKGRELLVGEPVFEFEEDLVE